MQDHWAGRGKHDHNGRAHRAHYCQRSILAGSHRRPPPRIACGDAMAIDPVRFRHRSLLLAPSRPNLRGADGRKTPPLHQDGLAAHLPTELRGTVPSQSRRHARWIVWGACNQARQWPQPQACHGGERRRVAVRSRPGGPAGTNAAVGTADVFDARAPRWSRDRGTGRFHGTCPSGPPTPTSCLTRGQEHRRHVRQHFGACRRGDGQRPKLGVSNRAA